MAEENPFEDAPQGKATDEQMKQLTATTQENELTQQVITPSTDVGKLRKAKLTPNDGLGAEYGTVIPPEEK